MLMLFLFSVSLFFLATILSFLKSRNHSSTPNTLDNSEMNPSEDFEGNASEGSETSASEDSDHSIDEVSEAKCYCGVPAKLRVSHTHRNPFRLFYNCNNLSNQCGYFKWVDEPDLTGDKHVDELNLVRNECIRLQAKLDETEQQLDNDRDAWEMEKSELTSKFSNLEVELDEIKGKIKLANESDLMPPTDKLCSENDEEDDNAIEIHSI